MTIFLDVGPVAAGAGLFAGVVLFFVLAAAAFVAFKMLKRSVKMAFRLVILGLILVIAIAGGISIWWLIGDSPKPPTTRPRSTQTK